MFYTLREKTLRNKTHNDLVNAIQAVLDGRQRDMTQLDRLDKTKRYTIKELNNLVDKFLCPSFL
jgi:hypothetical protein